MGKKDGAIYMEKFITLLNELAEANLKEGGAPYSALVVFNDTVIATGVNEAHKSNDPTHHAELVAIQKAVQLLKPEELAEATIYASGEPCQMCYTAAQFTNIKNIYYVVSRDEIIKLGKSQPLADIPKHHTPTLSTKQLFEKW